MPRVLLIEDDHMYRKIYTRKFEISGYTVDTAENGAIGLAKMHSFEPDIVWEFGHNMGLSGDSWRNIN